MRATDLNKRLCVGIPTINRADLLNEALKKYEAFWLMPKSSATDERFGMMTYIVDNGHQEINTHGNTNVEIYRPESNLGVAGSWNWLAKKAFEDGFENILLLNDDVELCKTWLHLHRQMDKHTPNELVKWSGTWSCFVLPKYVWEKIGEFDTGFHPAYFEDNDYERRIQLDDDCEVVVDNFFKPTLYRNSMTIQKDPRLNAGFMLNQERYIRKWGGLPEKEAHKEPFGGKEAQ
jgi:GT2 family glycosyltransferase